MSVNLVNLSGRLGKTPEYHATKSAKEVASFSIAVDQGYTDRNTKKYVKKDPLWVRVVTFDENIVAMLKRNAQQGRKVFVTGRLEHSQYTAQDNTVVHNSQVRVGYGGSISFICADKGRYVEANAQPTPGAETVSTPDYAENYEGNYAEDDAVPF